VNAPALQVGGNERVHELAKRNRGAHAAGRLILRHYEEMDDFAKPQSISSRGSPFIDTVFGQLQNLVQLLWADLLGME
jgi:hypothetical protein